MAFWRFCMRSMATCSRGGLFLNMTVPGLLWHCVGEPNDTRFTRGSEHWLRHGLCYCYQAMRWQHTLSQTFWWQKRRGSHKHTYINRIRNDLTADYSKVWRLGYKLWSPKYQVVRISEGISLLTPSVGNNVNYGTVKIFGKLKNWFIDHREEFNRVVLWLNLIWLYLCNYTQTLWHRNSWKDAMKLKWISEFLIAQV